MEHDSNALVGTLSKGIDDILHTSTNSPLMAENDIFYAPGQFGDPVNPIQQHYEDTCAIKSQQLILNEFGINVTEDQLVQYSAEQGWYQGDGTGTQMQDVGNLLETASIPCTRQADANVFNLVSELSQGHKVIVGVDADELWGNRFTQWLADFFMGDTPNHALIVAGIDTTDPDHVKVIVTDPGNGDYHKSYPLDQFMDAWADSSHYMVATDIAVPSVVPGMEHFNYEAGHIDNVAGVDYPDFQLFNDISAGVPVYADATGAWPMLSLVDAYADYGQADLDFTGIFDPAAYDFNHYLDHQLAYDAMFDTIQANADLIDFTSATNWDAYMASNQIGEATTDDYRDFLANASAMFLDSGDDLSAGMCEQQLHFIDYLDLQQIDFSPFFIN